MACWKLLVLALEATRKVAHLLRKKWAHAAWQVVRLAAKPPWQARSVVTCWQTVGRTLDLGFPDEVWTLVRLRWSRSLVASPVASMTSSRAARLSCR